MTSSLTSLLESALSARPALIDPAHEAAFGLFNGFTEGCPEIVIDIYAATAVIHNYADNPEQGAVLVDEASRFLKSSTNWLEAGIIKTIGESDQSIIQMAFSLPLPILDRGKGKQEEARANVHAAEAELRAVQQQLEREWANARERYGTAVDQVRNYRERVLPKAADALRLVQIGFEEGKFGFIDLVDTQRTTAEARLAYLNKLLEMNVAQAELEALAMTHSNALSPDHYRTNRPRN